MRGVILSTFIFFSNFVYGSIFTINYESITQISKVELNSDAIVNPTITLGYKTNRSHGLLFSGLFAKSNLDYFFSGDINYSFKNVTSAFSYFQNLNDTIDGKQGVKFSTSYFLNHRLTILGGDLLYFSQKTPVISFNRIEDFKLVESSDHINGKKIGFWLEQVLSSKLKTKLDLFVGIRQFERPSHFGVKTSWAYSFTDQFFSQLSYLWIEENQDEKLLNNTGYLTFERYSASIIVEPIFDLLLSFSYFLTREVEFDPRNGEKLQVGTDALAVKMKHSLGKISYNIDAQYGISNIDNQNFVVAGGIAWDI